MKRTMTVKTEIGAYEAKTRLPELLREASHWRMIVFATILIVATIFMPKGIIFPLITQLVHRRWRPRNDRAA